ncbi:MAG: hypothetical protein KA746_09775 [Pyrinomonadaceae bacterium]|nr:hypothetical protein [Pyrinomonadaceae bacterium]MBP6212053.1 hypothetical protein [Pyrinomonadaceae bacterium]
MAVIPIRSTTERNKLIAAGLLGLLALMALYFAFGGSLFGRSSSATAKATPTPKAGSTPAANRPAVTMPSVDDQNFAYQTTPIEYRPGNAYAPDAGRNIFAFYEPPVPTPYVPTPAPPIEIKTPVPTPTPELMVAFMQPQTVYAGSKGFRLEVNGDRFTPESRIYFSQSELPTTFINAQKLVADIPPNFIAQEGPRQIIVQTPDGKKYSNQAMFQVQAPPRPGFQYIGMIARKRYNNDTAYFLETGKTTPFGARLNDVLGGRFRLVNISSTQVVFEDTSLGFKHPLAIVKPSATAGTNPGVPAGRPNQGFPDPGFQPFNPGNIPQGDIPGIPNNIPRYVPPQPANRNPTDKKDVDDDDGDGRP